MKTPIELNTDESIFSTNCDFNINDVANELKISMAKLSEIILFDSDVNSDSKVVNCYRWAKNSKTMPYFVYQRCRELLIANDRFQWNDKTAQDFVNWYINLMKLPLEKYVLVNDIIIKSFKNGDTVEDWG